MTIHDPNPPADLDRDELLDLGRPLRPNRADDDPHDWRPTPTASPTLVGDVDLTAVQRLARHAGTSIHLREAAEPESPETVSESAPHSTAHVLIEQHAGRFRVGGAR